MPYTIVDLDGSTRDCFEARGELELALYEAELEHPGSAQDLYVFLIDDAGEQVGDAERGDEVLANLAQPRSLTVFYSGAIAVRMDSVTRNKVPVQKFKSAARFRGNTNTAANDVTKV